MNDLRLTGHARVRLAEHCSLTGDDIALRFCLNRTVPLRKENGTNRVHHLFWSEPDRYWFVAVIDEKTFEAVTIMPVDYQNRHAVAPDATAMARRLADPLLAIQGLPTLEDAVGLLREAFPISHLCALA